MLTHDQLATVRAALLFWQEEICPHTPEVSLPYLDVATTEILSAEAVAELRSRFTSVDIRYVLINRHMNQLISRELFDNADDALQRGEGSAVIASVLLQ